MTARASAPFACYAAPLSHIHDVNHAVLLPKSHPERFARFLVGRELLWDAHGIEVVGGAVAVAECLDVRLTLAAYEERTTPRRVMETLLQCDGVTRLAP